MSETPEHANDPTGPVGPATSPAAAPPPPPSPPAVVQHKPNRLYQVAAWVAIVAGSVVIVATIFSAGFVAGKASDGGHGHFGHHHGGMKFERSGPMMPPGGPGQGHMWPGPGNFGPAGPGGPGMRPDEPDRPRPGGTPGPTTPAPAR